MNLSKFREMLPPRPVNYTQYPVAEISKPFLEMPPELYSPEYESERFEEEKGIVVNHPSNEGDLWTVEDIGGGKRKKKSKVKSSSKKRNTKPKKL